MMDFIAQLTNIFWLKLIAILVALPLSFFLFRKWTHWALLWLSFFFMQGVVWFAKYLIGRQRPVGDHLITNPSFPSGAAADAGFLAAYLTIFYPKYWLVWHGLGFAVVFLRVYAGAHYVMDVVVGYALGIVLVWLIHRFFGFARPRLSRIL